VAAIVSQRTQAEWDVVFAGKDACYAPVLTYDGAASHPQVEARGDGSPRFARSQTGEPRPARAPGADTRECLDLLGLRPEQISRLLDESVVRQAKRAPDTPGSAR